MADLEPLETPRLSLRRPRRGDVPEMFARYASDPEVTRYVGWPRHRTVADTMAFLDISDRLWERWGAGPFVIRAREDARLLGSTGLVFEAPERAMVGYVLACDAWGHGYAAEALDAMVALTAGMGAERIYALCHTQHRASSRVLEKCAFTHEGTWAAYAEFPNFTPGVKSDVSCWGRAIADGMPATVVASSS